MLAALAVLAAASSAVAKPVCTTKAECTAARDAIVAASGRPGLGKVLDNVIGSRSDEAWEQRPMSALQDTDKQWCPNASYWVS